ncbi:MAG: hypothetical protein IJ428_06820 [Clostridia bacterium]|nr:hypothetical protein [Clostridia bacterium]
MKSELTATADFDPDRLSKSNYLLSLANEALRCGLYTEEQYGTLESRLYECLAAKILLYTGGRSTSVESTAASRLLGSLLYTADLSLLRSSPTDAVYRVLTEPLWDICEDGMKLAGEYTLKALYMLSHVKKTRIDTVCITYNRLLNSDLRRLIRAYDISFDARRSLITADYPLPTVNKAVRGIGGMIHLLEELSIENRFVNSFPRAEFETLQLRFAPELTNPYGGTLINLGQLCFEQALLNLMADKPAGCLILSDADCRLLTDRYTSAEAYSAAIGIVHHLEGRAPERYLMKLLYKFRVSLSAAFGGGEAAIRNLAGFRDR